MLVDIANTWFRAGRSGIIEIRSGYHINIIKCMDGEQCLYATKSW